MVKYLFYLLTLFTLIECSEQNSVEDIKKVLIEDVAIKNDRVKFRMRSDKDEIILGDSIRLDLELKINDSIIITDLIYSMDDTLENINWVIEGINCNNKYSLWFSAGRSGVYEVNGKIKIPQSDSSYWENWHFQYTVNEK